MSQGHETHAVKDLVAEDDGWERGEGTCASDLHVVDVTSLLSGGEDCDGGSVSLSGPAEFLADRHPALTHRLPIIHVIVCTVLGPSFPLCRPVSSMVSIVTPWAAQARYYARGFSRDSTRFPPLTLCSSLDESPCEGGALTGEALMRQLLSVALLGDDLSAHYVCLSIMSNPYTMFASSAQHTAADGSPSLGVLPVNLIGLAEGDVRIGRLVATLREVVPRLVEVISWCRTVHFEPIYMYMCESAFAEL